MGAGSLTAACRKMGLNRTTPHHWDNLEQLEEVVTAIQIDQIDGARWALTNLSVDAVKALKQGLGERANRVRAADSILDRVGIPKQSAMDVTSGGETIKAVVYIPDNGRDDD